MACCLDCGKSIDRVGSGRPRKRCYECAPPKVAPKGDVDLSCSFCNAAFSGRSNAKYCSVSCQDGAREHRRGADCAGCSKRIVRSRTSADVKWCLSCRRAGLAPSAARHGTSSRYDAGCRCDECRTAKTAHAKKWRDRRRASGNPVVSKRRMLSAVCEACQVSFMARPDQPGRFCSMECAGNVHGVDEYRGRPNIPSRVRKSICERDGDTCQLCLSPVRHDVDVNHPRYPNMDHVVPFSKGGSDDAENLRLTCRQCNMMRGNNVDWVPELSEVRGESSREVA